MADKGKEDIKFNKKYKWRSHKLEKWVLGGIS